MKRLICLALIALSGCEDQPKEEKTVLTNNRPITYERYPVRQVRQSVVVYGKIEASDDAFRSERWFLDQSPISETLPEGYTYRRIRLESGQLSYGYGPKSCKIGDKVKLTITGEGQWANHWFQKL
jgi:hypothetical protein